MIETPKSKDEESAPLLTPEDDGGLNVPCLTVNESLRLGPGGKVNLYIVRGGGMLLIENGEEQRAWAAQFDWLSSMEILTVNANGVVRIPSGLTAILMSKFTTGSVPVLALEGRIFIGVRFA